MSQQSSYAEAIARAIADDLNAGQDDFCMAFLARFDPEPNVELKDLNKPLVTTRDIGESIVSIASRAVTEYEYQIEVNVWQKVTGDTSQRFSDLKLFAEQVLGYFKFIPSTKSQWPTGCNERLKSGGTWEGVDDNDLNEKGILRARITLPFRGWR